MSKEANRYSDSWDDYDEDFYPAGDDKELEYEEEWEDEEDEYPYGYTPVQGNWDPRDYEEDAYTGRKVIRKTRSVKTVYENNLKAKKKQKQKIRAEAKAKEKQRQQYYHYEDDE